MNEEMIDALFRIFESKMAELCDVKVNPNVKTLASHKWFDYIDSLSPEVATIRPAREVRLPAAPRKTGNTPIVKLIAERINSCDSPPVIVEDPGVDSGHNPLFGPNLLLVDRSFAERVLVLGSLP